MNRTNFTLTAEVRGLLVIRPSLPQELSVSEALKELEPYLRETQTSSEWPGTILYGEVATVYRYRFELSSAAILKRLAEGLYDWEQPKLLEDLCLLREDDNPWLVSIAHEKDSYLSLADDERTKLVVALPEIEAMLVKDNTE
jgi:hypothetical protein